MKLTSLQEEIIGAPCEESILSYEDFMSLCLKIPKLAKLYKSADLEHIWTVIDQHIRYTFA